MGELLSVLWGLFAVSGIVFFWSALSFMGSVKHYLDAKAAETARETAAQ